jgi:hypothetical protein
MIAITEYHVEEFGITLPAACIEITEVNSSKTQSFYQEVEGGKGVHRNSLIRYKIWVDEQAYQAGKKHLAIESKFIDLSAGDLTSIHNIALNLAFTESTIK